MEHFFAEQERLLRTVGDRPRYLFTKIDWDAKCIGIVGARGTGKTTTMLQQIKKENTDNISLLYISVDTPYFQTQDLLNLGKNFHQMGGKILFIDEIHKYPNWAQHVKSLYDVIPELKIVFSGSSLLQISRQKYDLSRRSVVYTLNGLSFREYIYFEKNIEFPCYSLTEILEKHVKITSQITKELKILKLFSDYLKEGYYPFFLEGRSHYLLKMREIINHILEVDFPSVNHVEARQIHKLKKLLYLLAISAPFVPNIVKLSQACKISRPKLYEYIEYMQGAKLINLIRSKGKGYAMLSKPEKLYLENTNLMYALNDNIHIGTLRELFFVNQLKNSLSYYHNDNSREINLSESGDFTLHDYTFEIGGQKKDFKQIANIKNSFVVADNIEIGFKNKIPLWLFGFLY